jgi:hypothetical protein
MTNTELPTTSTRRRRPLLTFSLRFLLLAVTAFAIGFAVWYRWPYTEAELTAVASDPFATPDKREVVTTWQRQWGGTRVKQGPEQTHVNGRLVSTVEYRDGVLEGPARNFGPAGEVLEEGEFRAGKKQGLWTKRDAQGKVVRTQSWNADVLDGPTTEFGANGKRTEFVFHEGRLAEINGRPARLTAMLDRGDFDKDFRRGLSTVRGARLVTTPLADAIDYLMSDYELPIVLDPHHVDSKHPINFDWDGLQAATSLDLLAAENDLACDYRYGLLWLTSLADAEDWRDPTGVSEIVPPAGSQLAQSWNEPVVSNFVERALADVLQENGERLAIDLDVSAIESAPNEEPRYLMTGSFAGLPFKHGLARLLYNAHCRCELRGETLVILPAE